MNDELSDVLSYSLVARMDLYSASIDPYVQALPLSISGLQNPFHTYRETYKKRLDKSIELFFHHSIYAYFLATMVISSS